MKPAGGWVLLMLLFATGLTSMGLEVVWIRQFTPYLGTVVYAFATVLAVYLKARHFWDRVSIATGAAPICKREGLVWVFLGLSALLPLFFADPQFGIGKSFRLFFGLAPFSGLLGFVTPMLVDRWSGGHPDQAGRAYAVNVVGCILGPLIAGFLLLPLIGERSVLIAFSLPWIAVGIYSVWIAKSQTTGRSWDRMISAGVALVAFMIVFVTKPYEDRFQPHEVLRDNMSNTRPRRSPRAGVVAGRRLDLDHPGAQVAEHHRGLRAGQGAGQVEDDEVGQRSSVVLAHVRNLLCGRRGGSG